MYLLGGECWQVRYATRITEGYREWAFFRADIGIHRPRIGRKSDKSPRDSF
jgi:hypothetical protein